MSPFRGVRKKQRNARLACGLDLGCQWLVSQPLEKAANVHVRSSCGIGTGHWSNFLLFPSRVQHQAERLNAAAAHHRVLLSHQARPAATMRSPRPVGGEALVPCRVGPRMTPAASFLIFDSSMQLLWGYQRSFDFVWVTVLECSRNTFQHCKAKLCKLKKSV